MAAQIQNQSQGFRYRTQVKKNQGPQMIPLNTNAKDIEPLTTAINHLLAYDYTYSDLNTKDLNSDESICILKNDEACSKDGIIYGCYCRYHLESFHNGIPMQIKRAIKVVPKKSVNNEPVPFLTSIIVADINSNALFNDVKLLECERELESIKKRFELYLTDFRNQVDPQLNELYNALTLAKPHYNRLIQRQQSKLQHISVSLTIPHDNLMHYAKNNLLNAVIKEACNPEGIYSGRAGTTYSKNGILMIHGDNANLFTIPILSLNMYDIMQILFYDLQLNVEKIAYLGNTQLVGMYFKQGVNMIPHSYKMYETKLSEEKTYSDLKVSDALRTKLKSQQYQLLNNVEPLTMSVICNIPIEGSVTLPIGYWNSSVLCHDGFQTQVTYNTNAQYGNAALFR